jgi:hypothetical protein
MLLPWTGAFYSFSQTDLRYKCPCPASYTEISLPLSKNYLYHQ